MTREGSAPRPNRLRIYFVLFHSGLITLLAPVTLAIAVDVGGVIVSHVGQRILRSSVRAGRLSAAR